MHIKHMVKLGLATISVLVTLIASTNWLTLHQLSESNLEQTYIVKMITTQEKMAYLSIKLINDSSVIPETILYQFQDTKLEFENIHQKMVSNRQKDMFNFIIKDIQDNQGVKQAIDKLLANYNKIKDIFLKIYDTHQQHTKNPSQKLQQQELKYIKIIQSIIKENKDIGFYIEDIVENSLSLQIRYTYIIIIIILIVTLLVIFWLANKIYDNVNLSVDEIEKQVEEGLYKITALNKEIEETQKEIILTMGSIAEKHDDDTSMHVKRVAQYCYILASYAGLNQKDCELIKLSSPMHDIGKIAIPDSILQKKGPLTDEERRIMMQHTVYGYKMLKHSKRELLKITTIIAYEHHERWDGKGYPLGLQGEEIHIFARIVAIADVFDALSTKRPYKDAWEDKEIFKFMKEQRGKQFDPHLIDIFFEHIDEFLEIRDKLKDNNNKN